MPRPTLYVAITNHGFGHATRTAAVLAELQQQLPDVLLIIATAAPQWLLATYLRDAFIYRPRTFDVGVVQSDSFTMDKDATLARLRAIQDKESQWIATESRFIRQNRVNLILADIPPLITKIAQAAEVPCWMCSNFGWDLIYEPWGEPFADIVTWVQDCFRQCDRLFRLPFHAPMETFTTITDVGLTGGKPQYAIEALRTEFSLHHPPERTVLLTFGGLGLSQIPYQNIQHFPDWQFITFDTAAPEDLPNLRKIQRQYHNQVFAHLRPVDLMPLCGRVISKPGYGTFAEACGLGIPVVSLPRSGFAETPLLLAGLQDYAWHQLLAPNEFEQGDWAFLQTDPCPPRQTQPLDKTGNQTVATAIANYLSSVTSG